MSVLLYQGANFGTKVPWLYWRPFLFYFHFFYHFNLKIVPHLQILMNTDTPYIYWSMMSYLPFYSYLWLIRKDINSQHLLLLIPAQGWSCEFPRVSGRQHRCLSVSLERMTHQWQLLILLKKYQSLLGSGFWRITSPSADTKEQGAY